MWNEKLSQKYTSENTSINNIQYPSTVRKVLPLLTPNSKWADIGGGKFDNVKKLFEEHQSSLFIYDPYNRSEAHNADVVERIKDGQCDGVMVNNVLNVIQEKDIRITVIKQAFDCLKPGGYAFFKIYEGNGTGVEICGSKDTLSYQANQKSVFYIPEIEGIFGEFYCVFGDIIMTMKSPTLEFKYHALIQKLKKISAPTKPFESVGKIMGSSWYLHKKYAEHLPQDTYKKALDCLVNHYPCFPFDVLKYDKKTEAITFIQSSGFNTESEPALQDSIIVKKDGTLKYQKGKSDPQIYHHKWLLVGPDYADFNLIDAMQRSLTWKTILGVNSEISSRIGTQSYWNQWLLNNGLSDLDSQKFNM